MDRGVEVAEEERGRRVDLGAGGVRKVERELGGVLVGGDGGAAALGRCGGEVGLTDVAQVGDERGELRVL